MPGNGQTNNTVNNRLSDIQQSNNLRSDAENNARNRTLEGAKRPSNSGVLSSGGSSINTSSPVQSLKSKVSDTFGSGGNQPSTNISSKTSPSSTSKSLGLSKNNGGLTPKQQFTKKGIQMSATAINPAVGAAMKTKTGDRVANALLQRKNLFASPFAISSIFPSSVKPEDKDKVDEQEKKDENRFGSVSVTISKKVKRILIPVTAACAVVVFGCCIIMVAAHSYNSILGMDLSSQLLMDDSAFKEMMDNGKNTSSGKSSSKSKVKNAGETIKHTSTEDRIEWLYEGKGVPQTKEESDSYTETYKVEVLDSEGNPTTMEVTTHEKLKPDVQEIFKQMKDAGFKITTIHSIREIENIPSGPFAWSAHTYGLAIDINAEYNCYMPARNGVCTIGSLYKPGVNQYSVTEEIVNIWKEHGFYWGGDWTAPVDYMHFSYFNH